MSISVLYIHHCGTFGGSSRSLLEMIKAFPEESVQPYLLTPKGNVEKFFKKAGIHLIETIGISQFDNTKYGFYRGFRWLIFAREVFYLFPTLLSVLKARSKWKHIEIVHINELTALYSIIFAKLFLKKPIVVHIRSVQQDQKAPMRYSFVKYTIKRHVDSIVAIDKTVKHSLPKDLAVKIIHNGFTNGKKTNFIDSPKDRESLAELFNAPEGYLKIAMVGNILIFKGVLEFVKAARICINKRYKILFYLIGANKNPQFYLKKQILKRLGLFHYLEDEIGNYIQKHNLKKNIYLINFTQHIHTVYDNIDILCFPSHLNAVGRPVIEAAFYKVPSIVAINDPLEDTMIDGKTGICIENRSPEALADAIEHFYLNPQEIDRMGQAAYQLALKNFDVKQNAKKMLRIYQNCLS